MPWLLCIAGTIFCFAGVYYFKKNAFEEDKSIGPPVLIMIMGLILIAIGTAKYFNLIN